MQLLKEIFSPTAPETETKENVEKMEMEEKTTEKGVEKKKLKKTEKTEKTEVTTTTAPVPTAIEPTLAATTPDLVTIAPGVGTTQELPAQKQETVREVEVQKIQPVIHREREQTEIKTVIQPIRTKVVADTEKTKLESAHVDMGVRVEAPSTMPLEGELGVAPSVESSSEYLGKEQHVQVNAPKVEEVVRKNVVEQIQPVIYQETVVPKLVEQTQHFYEKVQEAPVFTHELKAPIVVEVQQQQQPVVAPPQPPQHT